MQSISEFRAPDMSLYKEPENRCKCGAGDHCVRVERIPGWYVGTCICGAQKLTLPHRQKRSNGNGSAPKKEVEPPAFCGCGNPMSGKAKRCRSCGQVGRWEKAKAAANSELGVRSSE